MTKRTPEMVALASDLRRQGFTLEAVASTLRVNPSTARYWLTAADADRRRAAALARYADRRPRPPRQRPPAMSETFGVRLPLAVARELKRRAEAAGTPRSAVVRELLTAALGSLDH